MVAFVKSNTVFDNKTAFQLSFRVGTVYYISAKEVIDIEDSHYFIIIAKEDSTGYFIVSTRQLETILKHFKKEGLESGAIATLIPNTNNGLKAKYSYFNCNQVKAIDSKFLLSKIEANQLEIRGYLNQEEYNDIKGRIEKSDLVEPIIKKLLQDDYDI